MPRRKKPAVTPLAATPTSPAPAPAPAPAQPAPTANPTAPQTPQITGTASANNHTTKVDNQALYQAVITGLLAFYAPTDTFLIQSVTYTRDELITRFQAFIAAVEQTSSGYQQWRQDVQSERALELGVAPLRVGVRGIVQTRFGKQGLQLLQFGFQPAKVAVRTPASLVLASAKAKATRQARGTQSPKQKQAIHGTVTTVTVGSSDPPTAASAGSAAASASSGASSAPATSGAPAASAPAAPVSPVTTPTPTPTH
jgi:hypothetical protein